ncbi:SusC/RagA family TonB-linked outer membrane protein [Terrimonas rubra]|uniref:SusC/RagA family TonB-linked outer membrane protein n=1 Tax=Terrimonas rubra TaxID=1035890 RepID=A0ABW5ZZ62_9BACT
MNQLRLLKVASLLLFLFVSFTAVAQNGRMITGKVVDEATALPLEGVSVKVKNFTAGTLTNDKGEFTLEVPSSESVITFSYVGFRIYEIKAGTASTLDVKLVSTADKMDDVIVIGYGTQRAKDVTGSMATADLKKIQDLPVASLAEALRGQIPGLNVSGGSTRPGSLATLSIRQQFNWGKDGGGTIPLVVIDDVIQVDPQTGLPSLDRFNMLDISEVESITVLRDASAAIYGSRASQGAIVVKTKRGKVGAPRLSYSGKFQTNDAVSHGKVMNARQYGEFANRFGTAMGWNPQTQLYSQAELARMDSLNYDWLANDWRAAGAMQHSLDVSGGSDRATYFTGVSYYTQGANLGSQDFTRWTYRAGTDVKVMSGMRLGATIAAGSTNIEKSFTKVNISDGSYAIGGEQNDYNILLHMPKYIPWIYNINGVDRYVSPSLGPNKLGNVSGNNSLSNYNYYALLNNGSKTTNKTFYYNAVFSLNYEVPYIKGLSLKVNYGLTSTATNTEQIMLAQLLSRANNMNTANNHLYSATTVWDNPVLNRSNSRVTYDNTTSTNQQMNFFVNYERRFGDHSISAMASVERAENQWEDRYQIYDNPIPGAYNGTSVSAGTLNTSNSITYRTESGSLSYLGRLNYSYKNKYLLQFVYRQDASTRFAPENYWGSFPGVSAGWVVSEESWFKDNVSWMDYLKIRGSLARTGNDNVKAWKWMQLYKAETDKGMGFGSNGGNYTTGITPEASPNRDVKWDRTTQRNLGLDMAFLKNRLSIAIDGYYNTTSDMLTDMTGAINVPISVGGAFAEQNYSGVKAWGTEIAATWRETHKDFNYSIGMNFGLGDNKITKYFDQPFDYPNKTTTRREVGQSTIAPVWGFKTWKGTSGGDGMLRTDADIDNYWAYLTDLANKSGVTGAVPNFMGITNKSLMKKGMLVYEDVAGALDANNRTIAGPNGTISKDQDYVKLRKSSRSYGITTNLSVGWKDISLTAQIATSWGGANFLDYIKQGTSSTHSLWSHPIYLTDMYDSASNPNGKYPNLAYFDQFGGTNSDFFMLSNFRMVIRTLSIGYTLPKAWVNKAKIQSARVFIAGNNLWDLYNPYPNKYRNMYDAPNVGYPTLRTWALGVNVGF